MMRFKLRNRKMQSRRGRVEKVGIGQPAVILPRLFKLHRLESQAGPALFQAFADSFQRFVDTERWDKQLNRLHFTLMSAQPDGQADVQAVNMKDVISGRQFRRNGTSARPRPRLTYSSISPTVYIPIG